MERFCSSRCHEWQVRQDVFIGVSFLKPTWSKGEVSSMFGASRPEAQVISWSPRMNSGGSTLFLSLFFNIDGITFHVLFHCAATSASTFVCADL